MPITKAGKALLELDAYIGSFLSGPIEIGPKGFVETRENLRRFIDDIEEHAIEIGRNQHKKQSKSVEAVE